MSFTGIDQYDCIKEALLREFHITPREFRARFLTAVKRGDETYSLPCSRLHRLLSRQADGDINHIDLLVVDRLKDSLPATVIRYVLSVEGSECPTAHKLAVSADIYASNYTTQCHNRALQMYSVPLVSNHSTVTKLSRNRAGGPSDPVVSSSDREVRGFKTPPVPRVHRARQL